MFTGVANACTTSLFWLYRENFVDVKVLPFKKWRCTEEAEWMAYFHTEKEKAQALQNDINRLDKEIDQMVYGLYGLTEEEVAIVEKS